MKSITQHSLAILLFIFSYTVSIGQSLSEVDQKFIASLTEKLELDSAQQWSVDSLYKAYQPDIDTLDQEIKSVEKSDEPEEDIVFMVSVKRQEQKDLRAEREMELLGILTIEQRDVYQTKIKPKKPQVLHFGIHNRADCNVCNK